MYRLFLNSERQQSRVYILGSILLMLIISLNSISYAQSEVAFSELALDFGYDVATHWQVDGTLQLAIQATPTRDVFILDNNYNIINRLDPTLDTASLDFLPYGPKELAWSSDGLQLAVIQKSGAGEFIQLWDMTTLTPKTILTGIFRELHWQPNGQLLAVSEQTRGVIIYDTNPTQEGVIHEFVLPAGAFADDLAWKPDGSQIAAKNDQDVIQSWDVASGNTVFALNFQAESLQGLKDYHDLDWHPTEEQLALYEAGEIEIWDTTTINGTLLRTFPIPGSTDILWTPDGIATYRTNGGIAIWDPQTGNLLQQIPLNEGDRVMHFEWNPYTQVLLYLISLQNNNMSFDQLVKTTPACSNPIPAADVTALAAAITTANGAGVAQTICLEAGTYTLTSVDNSTDGDNDLPSVTGDVTLVGLGAGALIVGEIETIETGHLTLENVTIED